MREIIRHMMGPSTSEEKVDLITWSIVGQCTICLYNPMIIARLYPGLAQSDHDPEKLIRHVIEFTFVALGIASSGRRGPQRPRKK